MMDNQTQGPMLGPGEMLATPEQTAAAEAGQLPLLDMQEIADRYGLMQH